ncbi:translation initiation factor IF-2-like [Cuculus canorus]|uniref:translation initiation factor IF-2-like n=1 Tax=Cuculus canorus TaxID=55661 RepID=UPI0023AA644E|nr:translation initiation factor IF-2-like [Cuculus canorus]
MLEGLLRYWEFRKETHYTPFYVTPARGTTTPLTGARPPLRVGQRDRPGRRFPRRPGGGAASPALRANVAGRVRRPRRLRAARGGGESGASASCLSSPLPETPGDASPPPSPFDRERRLCPFFLPAVGRAIPRAPGSAPRAVHPSVRCLSLAGENGDGRAGRRACGAGQPPAFAPGQGGGQRGKLGKPRGECGGGAGRSRAAKSRRKSARRRVGGPL